MLNTLTLESFRCFQSLDLPLRPLTLLTGFNGAGKSTLIQALAVFQQTILHDARASMLLLNGPELSLGTFNKVVHDLTDNTYFAIGIASDDTSLSWRFEAERDDVFARLTTITLDHQVYQNPSELNYLLPADPDVANDKRLRLMQSIASMNYLTSERPTPEAAHRLELPQSVKLIGRNGKNAVGLLHRYRDEYVEEGMRHPEVLNPRLIAQVEGWMRSLFPGFRMQIRPVPDTSLVALGIRLSDATNFHEPAHTGYGITQVLPVLVAALVTRPGGILAVENPENDLHPSGQAFMGEFLCRVATCGVQVLVETHSDHVLNGVRRGVKENTLGQHEAIVHFLSASGESGPKLESLDIQADGRIATWPIGFFDQLDRDLEYFAGWSS